MSETSAEIKKFSVIDFLTKRAMPEDSITVYTDAQSGYELKALEAQDADERDPNKSNEIAAKIEELREKIRASGLTFYLRGLPTKVHRSINDEAFARFKIDPDADERPKPSVIAEAQDWTNYKTIAETIVKVESADGSVDDTRWDVEKVEGLRDWLPQEEYDRLFQRVSEIHFRALEFEQEVNADF